MQRVLLVIVFFFVISLVYAQSAAINNDGSNAEGSAILDVKSTNKGFLLPRMTTAQRTAIVLPAKGLKVFDTDTNSFWFHNGTAWVQIATGIPSPWKVNSSLVYLEGGAVGIGTNVANNKLEVVSEGNAGITSRSSAGSANIEIDAFDGNAIFRFRSKGISKWKIENEPVKNSLVFTEGGVVESRMFIQGGTGNVGIGTNSPTHKLSIEGVNSNLLIKGSFFATLDLDAFSEVAQIRFSGNGQRLWNIGTNNNLDFVIAHSTQGQLLSVDLSSGTVDITKKLTVDDGKGIVRSSNSNQLKMHYVSGDVGIPDAPSGYFADVTFGYPDIFTGIPRVSVANIVNGTGTFHRWVLTVHSVDVTARTFKVRFYNSSSTASTFSGTYYFLMVGAAND